MTANPEMLERAAIHVYNKLTHEGLTELEAVDALVKFAEAEAVRERERVCDLIGSTAMRIAAGVRISSRAEDKQVANLMAGGMERLVNGKAFAQIRAGHQGWGDDSKGHELV